MSFDQDSLDTEGYDDGWGYSARTGSWIHTDSGVVISRGEFPSTPHGLAMARAKQTVDSQLIAGINYVKDEFWCEPQGVKPLPSQLEQLRWHKFPCLDDGFVCLVDVMGDDAAIVQAARVSYGRDVRQAELGLSEKDEHLIRFMMRHGHTSPFEMCELKFLVRCPMDVWRQWIRHRTANVNEYSTRYTEAIDSCQRTPPDEWRLQDSSNKQGSDGYLQELPEGYRYVRREDGSITVIDDHDIEHDFGPPPLENIAGEFASYREGMLQRITRMIYEERLKMGIAREQARKDLPLSTYTEAYWKIDLHNLLHFLEKRMDPAAQWEIRQYATTIGQQIVAKLFPATWRAFSDYRLNSVTLSPQEQFALRHYVERYTGEDWPVSVEAAGLEGREARDFMKKVKKMGIS